jgi:hypothetical protein
MNQIRPYNKTSESIRLLLHFDSILDGETYKRANKNQGRNYLRAVSKKRSRSYCRNDEIEDLMRRCIQVLDQYELFPTLKTLCDEKFYLMLAYSEQHVVNMFPFIHEFRILINSLDKDLANDNFQNFFQSMTTDMFNLLANCQQPILILNSQCSSSSQQGQSGTSFT